MPPAVVYTIIPVSIAVCGAVLTATRPPSEQLQSSVQHVAAGIIFAAVALELLPPIRGESPFVAAIGFSIGILAMMLLRSVGKSFRNGVTASQTRGFAAAAALDVLIDGVILGATFTLGTKQGVLLTAALAGGLLFLSISVATTLSQANVARRMIILTVGLIALAMPVGAAGGAILLRHAGASALTAVLAFGAVALMYVVTEELLVRAHRVRSSQWAMPLFFLAFLAYLVLVEVIG